MRIGVRGAVFTAVQIFLALALFFGPVLAAVDEHSDPGDDQSIEGKWGISIENIRLTAGSRLVDFRYRVLDPEKAKAVFDRRNKVYLVDEASGVVLGVPRTAKVGPLRQTNFKPDPRKVYFVLFSNPGVVESGSLVTLVVGDEKLEGIKIQ